MRYAIVIILLTVGCTPREPIDERQFFRCETPDTVFKATPQLFSPLVQIRADGTWLVIGDGLRRVGQGPINCTAISKKIYESMP